MKAWTMWLLAALFYALDYFQHTAPSVLILPIAHSLQTPMTTIGNIMSLYFPVYAISQIPAGILLDRYGLKHTLTAACCIVSIGLYCSTHLSLNLLLLGRILVAIGSAFAFLGAIKAASLWLSRKIFPIAVGLTNTIGVIGGLLGQPLLNELILRYHWQQALLMITSFGLLLAILLVLFLQSPRTSLVRKHQPLSFQHILKTKPLWLLALYAGIMVGTVVNAIAELYGVPFLQDTLHLSSEYAATLNSMTFVGIAFGGPLHGVIASRFRVKRRWMLIANTITIFLFALMMLIPTGYIPLPLIFVLYFLIGFFVSSMLLSFGIVRSHYPEDSHASIFAFINMIIGIGGAVSQILLGSELAYLFHHHLDQQSFTFSILILLVPLLLSWYCCKRIQKAIFLLPA